MAVRLLHYRGFLADMEYWLSLRRIVFTGIVSRSRDSRILSWGILLIAILAGGELAGRMLGLHSPILYQVTSYGYRVAPDQDVHRFGNRVRINQQGLRNEPVAPLPAVGTLRILCVGDSITNGGAITDQDDTYPYQLQRLLSANGKRFEVLNASAPGWAISNEAGWLNENGPLGSRAVVLTIGTLDLFQERADSAIVDNHPSFPSRAPALALEELVDRYLMPRLMRRSVADPGAQSSAKSLERVKENIGLLLGMADLVSRSGAVPVVLFVEQPKNFEMRDLYTVMAKALLFDALAKHSIHFANTRDPVELGGGASLFRDRMHPNTAGNAILARVAAGLLTPVIVENARSASK
jgi:lysophospholipase L1-like esterase